ncbi:hypothetical protein HanRHA438_Chr13g0617931 [Helianthus annuus]|nr:hypothetical protein HanRHA438_Chr13g0617931 [Helianthus annuus]
MCMCLNSLDYIQILWLMCCILNFIKLGSKFHYVFDFLSIILYQIFHISYFIFDGTNEFTHVKSI